MRWTDFDNVGEVRGEDLEEEYGSPKEYIESLGDVNPDGDPYAELGLTRLRDVEGVGDTVSASIVEQIYEEVRGGRIYILDTSLATSPYEEALLGLVDDVKPRDDIYGLEPEFSPENSNESHLPVKRIGCIDDGIEFSGQKTIADALEFAIECTDKDVVVAYGGNPANLTHLKRLDELYPERVEVRKMPTSLVDLDPVMEGSA